MVQDSKSVFSIGNRQFTAGQLLFGLAVLLISAFILYGIITSGAADATEVAFAPTNNFVLLALLAFAGGLFSFLSPCTLPILPAYFAFAFRSGRTTIAANTLAFMFGLATMFSLFGAGASTLGTLLFQRQHLILLTGGALIILFGAMSILGKGFSGTVAAGGSQRDATLGGSFIFGLTFAVGWSSCIGPILGIVLTLAATTASVTQGIMLLFIYTFGLGLPLMAVSALMGRASRDSFAWRMLRGRGFERQLSRRSLALIWALVVWLIALPVIRYIVPAFDLDAIPLLGFSFTLFRIELGFLLGIYEVALLIAAMALAVLWVTIDDGEEQSIHLHSTSLISGLLFLLMGILLINNQLGVFNSLLETDMALWLLEIEERFLNLLR